FSKPIAREVDWSNVSHLEFWVYRKPSESDATDSGTRLEVHFVESDGHARFWRVATLDHEGWKRIAVPLQWCRWGSGRIPEWRKVNRVGFIFREAAEIQIDAVKAVRGP